MIVLNGLSLTFWSWSSSWDTICICTRAWAVLLSSRTCSDTMCFWNSGASSQRASQPVHLHSPGPRRHYLVRTFAGEGGVTYRCCRGCGCPVPGTDSRSCSSPECCYCRGWWRHSPSSPAPAPAKRSLLLSPAPCHRRECCLIPQTRPEKNKLILIRKT